jgi:hypothetical protein
MYAWYGLEIHMELTASWTKDNIEMCFKEIGWDIDTKSHLPEVISSGGLL